MMFLFWRALLQEVVPQPDMRIHGLRISRMSPWELSIAKSHVRGRYIFGLVTVAIVAASIVIVCTSNIHQGGASTIALSTIIVITVLLSAYRVICVSVVWLHQSKLIDQEIQRRQFDKAGKHCRLDPPNDVE